MKLIHNSINIAETADLETLKNQVTASLFIQLQEKDMCYGLFGVVCRYASIFNQGGNFYTFDRTGQGAKDWEIMKYCLHNAGDLDTIVHFKYAVWRDNEGWRCVSDRESGMDYMFDFFEPEMKEFLDTVRDILQRCYDGRKQSAKNHQIWLTILSRFEDWDQIIAKAEELKENKIEM